MCPSLKNQYHKSVSPYVQVNPFPPMLTEELEMRVIPEDVIKKRKMTDGSVEVLVKWQNLPESDNTWEPWDMMKEQFSSFNLEDKVLPDAGGNVGNGAGRITYARRKKNVAGGA